MEEHNKCEVSIQVSKEIPVKKKISLAEYKLRFQPEQPHPVIGTKASPSKEIVTVNNSTLTGKPGVSQKKSKQGKKRKKKKSKKGLKKKKAAITVHQTVQTSTNTRSEQEKQLSNKEMKKRRKAIYKTILTLRNREKHDSEFGITEYVSREQGFIAVVRQHSDIQVHEISLDGSFVHLTAENQMNTVQEDCELLKSTTFSSTNFLFTLNPLQSGDLKGNHFEIALRNLIDDDELVDPCHIDMCLKLLNEVGFINYHESQEFGNPGNKHLIGKDLILERWQEVIRYGKGLIVEPWLVFKNPRNIALACFEYKSSRNVDKDLGMEQYEKEPKPIKIISSIKLRGKNLTKALKTGIPLDLRISNVRAYQCFIWNKIVSKRIAKFGLKLVVGDLVLAQGHNKQDNQPEIIFIDDGNIHKFTIYDVVLPLPQHDTVYPANEITGWYNDVFQEDGISEKDFNLSSKTYGFGGGYRHIILRPFDLKWKFVRYDKPSQKLILSDLDRLQQIELPPVGILGGAHLGLLLEFSLPASAFASMALREILNLGLHNVQKQKQLDRSQERPSPLEANGINEPQIKETYENPCRINEKPLSEMKNNPASTTSEFCPTLPLRKVKLESGTIEKQPLMDSLVGQPPQPIPCPPPTSEYQLQEIPKEEQVTIRNVPPATKKALEEPQVKKEPAANERPSTITKHSSEDLQKNRVVLERSTSNLMPPSPPLSVNESLEEPQTKCVKEEPGISRTHSSTLIESCAEEPAKKKIKADPDAKPSNFKSIIYIDLASDEDD